jgi:hypothetical protein
MVEHVTTVVPSPNVLPLAGEHTTFNGEVTASVALALKVTTAPAADVASATLSAGTDTTGATVSRTVTLNDADPGLWAASSVEHVTTVVPRAKVLPLTREQPTVSGEVTASVALALNVTTAPAEDVASATLSAGTVTTGAIVSCTTTLNDADPGLCAPSSVEHVTTVVPMAKVLPLAREQPTVNGEVTASVALALNVTTAPAEDVASATCVAGTETTGAVVSRTTTLKEADAGLCAASSVEHVTGVVPSSNVLPLAGEQATVNSAVAASVAFEVNVNTAPAADVASAT